MMGKDDLQRHRSSDPAIDQHSTRSALDRRTVIRLSGALGASAALSGSALIAGLPEVVKAGTNPSVKLEVVELEDGRRTYNGLWPGPTITANAGDKIDVHLVNNLPKDDDDCPEDHNTFHGNNTTNLHTHGLHVSPYKDSSGTYEADNVFLKVVPKKQTVPCWDETFRRHQARYRFELPTDHPPGTHWYHAHKHGSTALQVRGGLAGPLIIRDPSGTMPSYIENAEEKVFMLMDFAASAFLVDPNGGGEEDPKIKMRPGEVQRWRIINASPDSNAFVHLGLDTPEVELWQIAFDGLTLQKRVKVDPNNTGKPWLNPAALAPGNRTDLMIRVPKDMPSGKISLTATPAPPTFLHVSANAAAVVPTKIDIEIEGDSVDDEWSTDDSLPGPGLEPFKDDPLPTREVWFEKDDDERFVIDGEPFSDEAKQTMNLGSSEEWTVYNTTSGTHPFHIHVNPFFVTHIDGRELEEDSPLRRWQDTIALPGSDGNTPGSVTFRSRFIDFRGKFVIHCHILGHEDRGMMQAVKVV